MAFSYNTSPMDNGQELINAAWPLRRHLRPSALSHSAELRRVRDKSSPADCMAMQLNDARP
jgi:hypothetical protein